MDNLNLSINQKGQDFYLKWKKDTNQSAFIFAPVMLAFYLGMGALIYGINIRYFLISIYPVLLICLGFIYPIFSRKKYINKMVESIGLHEGNVTIKTYKWLKAEAICEVWKINGVQLIKYKEFPFFKSKDVYALKLEGSQNNEFYIIGDFFDSIKDLLVLFDQPKV